jgi:hypothetical protein
MYKSNFSRLWQTEHSISLLGNLPGELGSIPETSGSFPKASGSFPKVMGSFPKASGSFPKASGNFPKVIWELPKSMYNLPQDFRYLPRRLLQLPQCFNGQFGIIIKYNILFRRRISVRTEIRITCLVVEFFHTVLKTVKFFFVL